MADQKISEMTPVPATEGTDVVPLVRAGENRSVSVDTLVGELKDSALLDEHRAEADAHAADAVAVADPAGNFAGSTVEQVLAELVTRAATQVSVQDSSNYWTGADVELVLNEIAAHLGLSDTGGSTGGTPDSTTDSDATSGVSVVVPSGTDRRLYAFVQVLSATVVPTGCLAGGIAMTQVGFQEVGDLNLYAYELTEDQVPAGADTLDVLAQWSAVPGADVQIHAVFLTNVTGSTTYATGTQTVSSSAAVASYDSASNTDPVLVPYPSGIVSGDLLVLVVAGDDPVTLPAGFTSRSAPTGTGANLEMLVADKVADGTETGSLSVTTADDLCSAILMRVPNGAFDVVGASTGDTAPSVTATSDGSLLLLIHGRNGPQLAPPLTVPAGSTELVVDTSDWRSAGVAYKQVDAGATGTQAFTMDGEWDSVSIALVLTGSGGAGGTLVDAGVVTTVNGEVVVSCCVGDSAADYPTTSYGTQEPQLADAASASRVTVNTATGTAGDQAVDWSFAGDGVVANAAALTLRVDPVTPTEPDPEPDTGSGATTIWNTKIATGATLQPSGFTTSGYRPDTGAYVSEYAMQAEPVHAIQLLSAGTNREVRECKTRPDTATQETRDNARVFLTAPVPDFSQTNRLSANNLGLYYDDDTGAFTGTPKKIITGGGKTYRPSSTGPVYHNWESPPSNLHDQQGTWDAPGRSGQTGAARLSQAGTMIRGTEWDAAVGGNASAIAHAIGFLVWCSPFVSRSFSGYRWPAFSADSNYNTAVSNDGSYNGVYDYLRMGALVCLESRVTGADFAVLGGVGTFPNFARAVAEALYLYGAYIGDNTSWPAYAITLEHDKVDAFWNSSTEAQRFQLRDMLASTVVVSSNGATTIGGAAAGSARRS